MAIVKISTIKVKEVLPEKNHHSNLEKGNCKDRLKYQNQ
jgi:hypothetical protein